MNRRNLVLLVAGIAVLAIGTWYQDLRLSFGGVEAASIISQSAGWPGWDDINIGYYDWAHGVSRVGLVLKLAGLGILFFLFLRRVSEENRERPRIAAHAAMLGAGSAACFAFAAVSSPATGIVTWTLKTVASPVYNISEGPGLEALRSAVFSEGLSAISSAILLTAGFFLLAGAIYVYRKGRGWSLPAASAAPAFVLLAHSRLRPEELGVSYGSLPFHGSVFTFLAALFPIAAVAIFIWALTVRKTRPGKASMLAVVLPVVAGLLCALFWGWTLGVLRSSSAGFERFQSAEEIGRFVFAPITSGYLLAVIMLFSSILVPILCAFALRPREEQEEMPAAEEQGRSPVFLRARVAVLAALVIAAFAGLYESGYRASLRRVSVALRERRNPEEYKAARKSAGSDIARLETDGGMEFLRSLMLNPREYYWHLFATWFLLEESENAGTGDVLLETLCSEKSPAAAEIVGEQLHYVVDEKRSFRAGKVCEMLCASMARNAQAGGRILQILLGSSACVETLQRVMGACVQAGVSEFRVGKEIRGYRFIQDERLVLPQEVKVVILPATQENSGRVPVKLWWCRMDSRRRTKNPNDGRTQLKAGGQYLPFVVNKMGERLPDYLKLMYHLKEQREKSKTDCIELELDAFVPSFHVAYVLQACAKAGINTVYINPPEIPY